MVVGGVRFGNKAVSQIYKKNRRRGRKTEVKTKVGVVFRNFLFKRQTFKDKHFQTLCDQTEILDFAA